MSTKPIMIKALSSDKSIPRWLFPGAVIQSSDDSLYRVTVLTEDSVHVHPVADPRGVHAVLYGGLAEHGFKPYRGRYPQASPSVYTNSWWYCLENPDEFYKVDAVVTYPDGVTVLLDRYHYACIDDTSCNEMKEQNLLSFMHPDSLNRHSRKEGSNDGR